MSKLRRKVRDLFRSLYGKAEPANAYIMVKFSGLQPSDEASGLIIMIGAARLMACAPLRYSAVSVFLHDL